MSGATDFDDVVVGSSPLMLLVALDLAAKGRRVAVLDRTDQWGGAWQIAALGGGEQVETACHLIEMFPGVYPQLAAASGVPFARLAPQPVRVHPLGFKVRYFSRVLLLATGMRLIVGLGRAWFGQLRGRTDARNGVINFRSKLRSYLRYQLPAFLQPPVMQGPVQGFAVFLEGLMAACADAGVELRAAALTGLQREDGVWRVDGPGLRAARVHLSTSVRLREVGAGRFDAPPVQERRRFAVVVDVAPEAIATRQSYVAFWRDPLVPRISRIDGPQGAGQHQRFLVEFHGAVPAPDALQGVITARMRRAGIVQQGAGIAVRGEVTCRFTQNIDQLPEGEIAAGLFAYHSSGNLAAGVAAWNKARQD